MQQRRRLVPTRSKWSTPVIAAVTSIALAVTAAFGGQQVLKTQDSGNGGPIEVKNSSSSFSDGESIVVDDPAVAAQGDGESRRAVKQFHHDETFNMFAVTWEGKRDINSFVRSKQQDGSWSEWLPMDAMNYTEGKNGTELIFVGDTNDVQVSMANVDLVTGSNLDKKEDSLLDKAAKGADANRPAPLAYNVGDISPVADERTQVADLDAVFIDGNAQEGEAIEPTAETAGMPKVVTRAGWGADESKRCQQPTYDDGIKAMTLHHTAGTNNYTRAQAAAQVRGAYEYHAQNLGWCDIGYNVLVDKFGTIYEGRYGGLDKAVQGAHVGGFNSNNWGISMIGNYETAEPSREMLNSVAEIAGWKAAISGIDPMGKASLYSGGFNGSKFPAGTTATVPAFAGHNDFHYTACPGQYTTRHWDEIRKNTKRKADSIKSGKNSTDLNWQESPKPNTPKTPQQVGGKIMSSLGDVEVPVSTISALAGIAAAVFGVLIANDRLQKPDTDQKVTGNLTTGDIPEIVNKVVQVSNNEGLKESWTSVLNAFGPVLGLAVGGPDTTDGGKILYQLFQNGVVLSSKESGTKALTGEIAKKWSEGDNASKLGLPTSNEEKNGKEIRVKFQGGEIVYNTETEKVDIFTD